MKPKRRSKPKVKAIKQPKSSNWVTHGNLAVVKIRAGTTMDKKLLDTISAEAEIYSDSLAVVIVPELDMRMNIQGKYENCLFVRQPNSKKLITALNKSLDALVEEAPTGMIADAALKKLRNSSEMLALCLNQKINAPEEEDEREYTPSRALKGRLSRYIPKGQSDPNTYYQLPDLRKYREEEEDFRGHHDKPE
jgi:hypothetical protein